MSLVREQMCSNFRNKRSRRWLKNQLARAERRRFRRDPEAPVRRTFRGYT